MTGAEVEAEPLLADEEYEAQLRELEALHPAPTWDDLKPEMKWLYESTANNTFDPEHKYRKVNIAIYGGRVVGTDPHWLRLSIRLSRELGVHPARILVITSDDFWESLSPCLPSN